MSTTYNTNFVDNIQLPDNNAYPIRAGAIPYGAVDSTSTATAFSATIPGIYNLQDGTCFWLKNGVITSASGFTVNINNLGAKPCYNNLTVETRDTTIFNIAYTMLFVYDSSLGDDGGFYIYRGYDSNSNTIGYQLRTNSGNLEASDTGYRYRLWFTSADGKKWVPANTSTSTDATTARTMNIRPINPFGPIVYNSTNGTVSSGARPAVTTLWQQYTLTIGYSYVVSLTAWDPVYVQCTPQSDGSAVMNAIVKALPTSNDGKIYIYLGIAYSTTAMELRTEHPVFYHDGTGIRVWTGKAIPTKTSELTNDSGYITDAGVTSFNGNTGAITYTAPVTSVNGQTGAVTIDIPKGASVFYGTSTTAPTIADNLITYNVTSSAFSYNSSATIPDGTILSVLMSYSASYGTDINTYQLTINNVTASISSSYSISSGTYLWASYETVLFVWSKSSFQWKIVRPRDATSSIYGLTKLSSSVTSTATNVAATPNSVKQAYDLAASKQDALVSGTNIKTINGNSILGSGDLSISTGSNYTAGDGINITNNEISVASNLTVSGHTAYISYAVGSGSGSGLTLIASGNYADGSGYIEIPLSNVTGSDNLLIMLSAVAIEADVVNPETSEVEQAAYNEGGMVSAISINEHVTTVSLPKADNGTYFFGGITIEPNISGTNKNLMLYVNEGIFFSGGMLFESINEVTNLAAHIEVYKFS